MQAPLKPKEKAALIAAYGAPNFTLRRTAFGFAPINHPEKVFTRRLINWLHERVLVRFDDRDLPRAVTQPAGTLIGVAVRHGALLSEGGRRRVMCRGRGVAGQR